MRAEVSENRVSGLIKAIFRCYRVSGRITKALKARVSDDREGFVMMQDDATDYKASNEPTEPSGGNAAVVRDEKVMRLSVFNTLEVC